MCDKPLESNSVRDHYHITGKCRGAAQSACNVKLRLNPNTTVLPVVFHNLCGNDSQLLMQAILKVEGKVSCIPNNTKKYLPFSMGQLRFIDSAQFLLASLNKLLAANQAEPFKITAQYEPNEARRKLTMARMCIPTSTWTPGRASREVPKNVPPPVRPRPRTLLHQTWAFMGRPSQEDKC